MKTVKCPFCNRNFDVIVSENEEKIVEALRKNPTSFSELKKLFNSPTTLSTYLKKLQKSGNIVRNIDTRKYELSQDYIAK